MNITYSQELVKAVLSGNAGAAEVEQPAELLEEIKFPDPGNNIVHMVEMANKRKAGSAQVWARGEEKNRALLQMTSSHWNHLKLHVPESLGVRMDGILGRYALAPARSVVMAHVIYFLINGHWANEGYGWRCAEKWQDGSRVLVTVENGRLLIAKSSDGLTRIPTHGIAVTVD